MAVSYFQLFPMLISSRALLKFLSFALILLYSMQLPAAVTRTVDKETGLVSWHLQEGSLDLELVQRLPDQTRGFFLGRGFSAEIANDIGLACVLQVIGKNISSDNALPIAIDLRDWMLDFHGQTRQVKLKETWNDEWQGKEVSVASKLAFRWATFPTEQTFEPAGDYNWGMISFDLPPQSQFDLKVVWQEGGEQQTAIIAGVVCPEDK